MNIPKEDEIALMTLVVEGITPAIEKCIERSKKGELKKYAMVIYIEALIRVYNKVYNNKGYKEEI